MRWLIWGLSFLFGAAFLTVVALAQFAPMPLYEHPAQGMPDPYKAWPNCCSGSDCTPWPGEDIEAMADGRYWIKSANGGRGAPVALNKIKHSFNGQYHLCKPIIDGDQKKIETYADGEARVYCLFVPDGM